MQHKDQLALEGVVPIKLGTISTGYQNAHIFDFCSETIITSAKNGSKFATRRGVWVKGIESHSKLEQGTVNYLGLCSPIKWFILVDEINPNQSMSPLSLSK